MITEEQAKSTNFKALIFPYIADPPRKIFVRSGSGSVDTANSVRREECKSRQQPTHITIMDDKLDVFNWSRITFQLARLS